VNIISIQCTVEYLTPVNVVSGVGNRQQLSMVLLNSEFYINTFIHQQTSG